MRIIVGLGNPGRRYGNTRHNAGWMALDRLAERLAAADEEDTCGGLLARCGDVWLFKPLGHMNCSGPPVARLVTQADVALERLLVLVDDLDLPLGRVRLRPAGSSGGHRGLESLIDALGTEAFPRLRLGIGPCPPGLSAREFVLSRMTADELDAIEPLCERAAEAALWWAREGIGAAMNRFNSAPQDQ